ncbi:Uncharacterized protein dnl_41180 [Desulfonema limicola]|uniref:Uncharacterized protein n=1 Tax=Desulfonema limicola TaxID=45656 RepID=A0A975BA12_9BACT|nr:Uncharacterized protein dnl_41180 [Desulfonema limicola]
MCKEKVGVYSEYAPEVKGVKTKSTRSSSGATTFRVCPGSEGG